VYAVSNAFELLYSAAWDRKYINKQQIQRRSPAVARRAGRAYVTCNHMQEKDMHIPYRDIVLSAHDFTTDLPPSSSSLQLPCFSSHHLVLSQ